MQNHAGEQDDARAHLDNEIAHAGGVGTFRAAGPDEEHRGYRRQLPEDEKGDQIADEHGGNPGTGVDHRGGVLEPVALVHAVDDVDEGDEKEDRAEDHGKLVDAHQGQRIAEDFRLAVDPVAEAPELPPAKHGKGQHIGVAPLPPQEGDQ